MKPRSKIPFGLVALTLAGIALTLFVFWSFGDSGLGAGSNMRMSPGGENQHFGTYHKIINALSPATFTILIVSLLSAYWVARQSGRFRPLRSGSDRGQLIDPSFSRAKVSLQGAARRPSGPPRDLEAESRPAAEKPGPAQIFHPVPPVSESAGPGQAAGPEAGARGQRRLSTTEPAPGLSLESRLTLAGQTGLQAAAHCPVGASMRNLIGVMQEISHSGRQIDQLVKIMNDFVFQANLLALEAAAEAGRAGRSGRGLVAMASRSRQLALCSAEAARNTSDLAASVRSQIQSGSDMVKTVAERFVKPVPALDEVGRSDSRPVSELADRH